MMKIAFFSLVMAIISVNASDNYCSKRLVRGKWVATGNYDEHKNVVREIEEKAKANKKSYSSCRGVTMASAKSRNETGGVFDIAIPGVGTKEVYCNTEIDGGGWIVMQRRMDGSVDFYRTWNEYVAGFGEASGEYWLGLEALYQLTKNGDAELRIDMIAHAGTHFYAKYSNFQIGASSDSYRLTVGGYLGNASDSLTQHNNRQFSTKNNDNDNDSGNCAFKWSGAWWFTNCHYSHLNGVTSGETVGMELYGIVQIQSFISNLWR